MSTNDNDKYCTWGNCDKSASAKIEYAQPPEMVYYCKEHFEAAKEAADEQNMVRKVEY